MVLTTSSTIITIILAVWLVTLGMSIIIMLFGKKIFKRANVSEKTAFIPIINLFTTLEIADASTWLGILLFVPGFNIIVISIMSFKLGGVFNMGGGFKLGLVFFPVIFYPILSLNDKQYKLSDEQYFRAIENSTSQKVHLPEQSLEIPESKFVPNNKEEEQKPAVDSIFKSQVQMMEQAAPYKATKINLLDEEEPLEELDIGTTSSSKKIDESKLLTDDDFIDETDKHNDMEIVDL